MVTYSPIAITASTTISLARHGDSRIVINNTAGLTLTLPAASGSGVKFRIFVGATAATGNYVIQVTGTDVMSGVCWTAQDSGDTVNGFETAADSDTITMNGTTKGGILGDEILLEDVASGRWAVQMHVAATGSEATPFSAAVS